MEEALPESVGKVNYKVDMKDQKKRHRVFHINMLQKLHVPTNIVYLAQESAEDAKDNMPTWEDGMGHLQWGRNYQQTKTRSWLT